MGRRGHLRREWDPSRGRGLVGIRLSWLLSASLQPAQVAGAPGAVIRVAVPKLEAWRSGMGSEGIQDSSGYLPEVLTVVADTAGTACPPGIQPCQSDQPRVQLVAHSWAETTPVGSQHLWAPRASGPENGTCVSGIAMRTAPPIHTHSLQSCHHQSPGPPVFRNDLEAATTRAPPAAHSPQHRVPTQEEERGWEG